MQTVIQKWENSLGIRIPSLVARTFNLKNVSSVEIKEELGKIIIIHKTLTLDELLSHVTQENLHSSVDTGDAVGKEEW